MAKIQNDVPNSVNPPREVLENQRDAASRTAAEMAVQRDAAEAVARDQAQEKEIAQRLAAARTAERDEALEIAAVETVAAEQNAFSTWLMVGIVTALALVGLIWALAARPWEQPKTVLHSPPQTTTVVV